MNRSPLFSPLNRSGDADAGGAADLQTDIMRFMAILALCLVAIFALVQSIPLTPSPPVMPIGTTADAPEYAAEEPTVEKPAVIAATSARPRTETTASPTRSAPAPSDDEPDDEPDAMPEEPAAAAKDQGFTLRFDSDQVLTRLVARNVIGVYAIVADRSMRLSARQARLSFWPASVPNQFYEMDPQTVPAEVLRTLRRSGSVAANDTIKWGVTLPGDMREQLDGYLADDTGGSLVIAADGELRLEQ